MVSIHSALNNSILSAHAHGDYLGLVALYTRAADTAESQDAECFFLTYAYVFALELGHSSQNILQARLQVYNRE